MANNGQDTILPLQGERTLLDLTAFTIPYSKEVVDDVPRESISTMRASTASQVEPQSFLSRFSTLRKYAPRETVTRVSSDIDALSERLNDHVVIDVEPEMAQYTPKHDTMAIIQRESQVLCLTLLHRDWVKLDAVVSSLPAIRACHSLHDHQALCAEFYNLVFTNLLTKIEAFEKKNRFTGENELEASLEVLLITLAGLYQFMKSRDVFVAPEAHAALALKMCQTRWAVQIGSSLLQDLPSEYWNEECYQTFVDLEAKQRPSHVNDAEQLLRRLFSSRDVEVDQQMIDMALEPIIVTPEVAHDGEKFQIVEKIKQNRWISFRVMFEDIWRRLIRTHDVKDWNVSSLPPEYKAIRELGLDVLAAMLAIAHAYRQYDYGWFWFESARMSDIRVLQATMSICKAAFDSSSGADKALWEGRSWAVYHSIVDSPSRSLAHHEISFKTSMKEFVSIVEVSEPVVIRVRNLCRISHDLLKHASTSLFPISDEVVSPLIEVCWNLVKLNAVLPEWRLGFDTLKEVYNISKEVDDAREEAGLPSRSRPLFSEDSMLLLLKLCTVSGHVNFFKTLNRDLHERFHDVDDYLAKITRGFAGYMNEVVSESTHAGQVPVTSTNSDAQVEFGVKSKQKSHSVEVVSSKARYFVLPKVETEDELVIGIILECFVNVLPLLVHTDF